MSTRDLKHPWKPTLWIIGLELLYLGVKIARATTMVTAICNNLSTSGYNE